ncbi:MAG: HAD family hydrolase [Clostridiales bacterium]|jgi:Cof subfamily protein (haloacid dehalogenase superfamily)|nr:HAD family hydrolase [Clostridiales bacterium]
MNIKLIITDLDNTLLRRDKTISEYTANVLGRCRERGILIAFATARPKRAVFEYIDILDKVRFDAMAFHNGAVIYCEGKAAAHYGIPHKTAKTLAVEFARLGLDVGVEIDDRNYANYDPSAEWSGMQYVLTDFASLPEKPADKIIIRKPSKADIEKIQFVMPPDLYVEMNEGVLGLIMSREATKQNATRFLTEKYGVSLAEAAAFGDDLNDVEMLRACGVGVAVANALDEVKAAADDVCGDCDEDGVARWLEENVL